MKSPMDIYFPAILVLSHVESHNPCIRVDSPLRGPFGAGVGVDGQGIPKIIGPFIKVPRLQRVTIAHISSPRDAIGLRTQVWLHARLTSFFSFFQVARSRILGAFSHSWNHIHKHQPLTFEGAPIFGTYPWLFSTGKLGNSAPWGGKQRPRSQPFPCFSGAWCFWVGLSWSSLPSTWVWVKLFQHDPFLTWQSRYFRTLFLGEGPLNVDPFPCQFCSATSYQSLPDCRWSSRVWLCRDDRKVADIWAKVNLR